MNKIQEDPGLNIFKSAEEIKDPKEAEIEINILNVLNPIEDFEIKDLEIEKELTEEEKPAVLCCKVWLIKAFMSGFTMGVGSYLFAVYQSAGGIFATSITGPLPAIILIIWKLQFPIQNYREKGVFIDKTKSNIFNPDGSYKTKNLIPLFGNWWANTTHLFIFTYAFKFAKMGGLNQGLIQLLTTFAIIYNSISFYFGFGEKLTMLKLLGMAIIISCVVCLALDSVDRQPDADDEGLVADKNYALLGLAVGMIVPMQFSAKHYLVRKYKGSYDHRHLCVDSGILESLTFTLLVIWYEGGYSWPYIISGSIAGCLMVLAKILVAHAVAEGMGGPAQALVACASLYMTICTLLFDNQDVTILQGTGLFLGLFGSFTVSTGDLVLQKCRKKSDETPKE